MLKNALVVASIIGLQAAPAHSVSFDIPGTNITVSDKGIKTKGPLIKTPEEILKEAATGSICGPLCTAAVSNLSEADKANVNKAISTAGFVTLVATAPMVAVTLAVLTNKGESRQVVVPTPPSAPTGKTWNIQVDCLTQQEGVTTINGMAKGNFDHVTEIKRGDTLNISAPVCQEYNIPKMKSITSVTIVLQGLVLDSLAADGDYRYYITGKSA